MRGIRLTYTDGNHAASSINGTTEEIFRYYNGSPFNFGDRDWGDKDNIQYVVNIELLDEGESKSIAYMVSDDLERSELFSRLVAWQFRPSYAEDSPNVILIPTSLVLALLLCQITDSKKWRADKTWRTPAKAA